MKDLAVKGKDLIELGNNEGKEIGQILKELLNLVLEKLTLNQNKILLTWVKKFLINVSSVIFKVEAKKEREIFSGK